MDRLSILLTIMTGAVLTGVLVILAFSFGWYGWLPILTAAAIGAVLSWPAAYYISRRTKRQDPNWDHKRVEDTSAVPQPGEREV